MPTACSFVYAYFYATIAIALLLCSTSVALAQGNSKPAADSTAFPTAFANGPDQASINHLLDSSNHSIKNLLFPKQTGFQKPYFNQISSFDSAIRVKKNSQYKKGDKGDRKPPLFALGGGYVSYGYSYRSNLDTPYATNNISQHQLIASINLQVAGKIPIQVNTFIRRSNSIYFRNITDVQVNFNAAAYRNQVAGAMQQQMVAQARKMKDSLAGNLYQLSKLPLEQIERQLRSSFSKQTLLEAHEVINVPQKAYDPGLPDSTNHKRSDQLQSKAKAFLKLYDQTVGRYQSLKKQSDSIKNQYDSSLRRVRQFEDLAKGRFSNFSGYQSWLKQLHAQEPSINSGSSDNNNWLLGIRKFSVGRSSMNSSELTSKNISLTGINLEYNTWYFVGVAAGLVDYRFRDFAVKQLRSPQYLYMLRLGLGNIDRTHIIFSTFTGQKQLFASSPTTTSLVSIKITGYSAEGRWQVTPHAFVQVEGAQSFSPDFRFTPVKTSNHWDFRDKSNKALAFKAAISFPKTDSRLEGNYKFTGSNFQSFNSFQTNAQVRSWMLRGEQWLWRRKIKLLASVRTNDFSNPYIIQNYKANTVFSTLSLSMRVKGWPLVTIGYLPMSQLTYVGTQLYENKFQTVNATATQFYKLGTQRASTTVVYNRFFNTSLDSGFIYYNASNVLATQTIFFSHFTSMTSVTYSKSPSYHYSVMEQGIAFPLLRKMSLGGGVKVNFLNENKSMTGGYVSANIVFHQQDAINIRYEKSFLPGIGNTLIPTTLGNLTLNKAIK